jgi:hypothetical protein
MDNDDKGLNGTWNYDLFGIARPFNFEINTVWSLLMFANDVNRELSSEKVYAHEIKSLKDF